MSDAPKSEPAEDGAEAAPLDGEKKGLPLKKILIIVVPLLLIVGGGAGAYFSGALNGLLGITPAAEEGADAEGEHGKDDKKDDGHGAKKDDKKAESGHGAKKEEKSGGHGEKKAEGGHGGGGGSDSPFLKVGDEKGQDLVVNLNTGDGQTKLLQLGVQLELEDPADADAVRAIMPRVIDQFQTYLRELRPKDLRGSAGIYRLQMELLSRVNEAAAPVHIKDVLFEKILIQ